MVFYKKSKNTMVTGSVCVWGIGVSKCLLVESFLDMHSRMP
jgi:hypothetical protein